MSHAANIANQRGAVDDGNVAGLLRCAAAEHPESCGLIFEGREFSDAELELRSQQAAAYLCEQGVQALDHVGLQLPDCPAFVALYFGVLKLGAVVVPQNPRSTVIEVEQNMEDSGAKLLLAQPTSGRPPPQLSNGAHVIAVGDDGLELFGEHAPLSTMCGVPGSQTAVILYTSGTTRRPKGAELTHSNLGHNALAAFDVYSLVRDDVVLGVLPLYHSHGQTCTLNGAIAAGARVLLIKRFSADAVTEAIGGHGVSVFLGVPTMFSDVAHHPTEPASFHTLRLWAAGGAPLPPEVRKRFERRSGTPLYETYGLSETSPIASRTGRALTRRPTIFISVPAVGTVDAEGCFTIVGRSKDVIIRGGHNVYPARSRICCIRIPRSRRPPSSAFRTPAWVRRSEQRGCSSRMLRSQPRDAGAQLRRLVDLIAI